MAGMDVWAVIQAERKALASDLAGLTGEQWRVPSLCRGWTVQDALAHMTATAKIIPPLFFVKIAGSGFSLARMQDKDIAVERGGSPAETLARFEAEIPSRKHPPGPADTMLGETIVHSEDIRRPLGIRHAYPVDAVVRTAGFFSRSDLIIGSKSRIAGLSLVATDADWSHGAGPEARGPILSLVMAMTGRRDAVDDLAGDGTGALRERSR